MDLRVHLEFNCQNPIFSRWIPWKLYHPLRVHHACVRTSRRKEDVELITCILFVNLKGKAPLVKKEDSKQCGNGQQKVIFDSVFHRSTSRRCGPEVRGFAAAVSSHYLGFILRDFNEVFDMIPRVNLSSFVVNYDTVTWHVWYISKKNVHTLWFKRIFFPPRWIQTTKIKAN